MIRQAIEMSKKEEELKEAAEKEEVKVEEPKPVPVV